MLSASRGDVYGALGIRKWAVDHHKPKRTSSLPKVFLSLPSPTTCLTIVRYQSEVYSLSLLKIIQLVKGLPRFREM